MLLPEPYLLMFNLGIGELGIILVIILIIFGPGKLPNVMRSLGDGVKQFKNATKDANSELTEASTEKKSQPES